MYTFYRINGHVPGKVSKEEQTKNMLKFLLGHLLSQTGQYDYECTKVEYVLYLFLLEYASQYKKFKIPERSILHNFIFLRTDSGVTEYTLSKNYGEIRNAICMCEVPNFRQTGFNQAEKKQIFKALQNARMRYLSASKFELGCFIKHDLNLMKEANFLEPLSLTPENIRREGQKFIRKRHILYSLKVR